MPARKTTTRRKPTRVSHAGTRRSETKTVEARPVETGLRYMGKENEDPRFPGKRTVVVPRDDPRDSMHMSPVGAYQGKGYEVISEDTQYTMHAGHVLMAIDVDEYNRREDVRLAEHNSRFVSGYSPELQSAYGEKDQLKFIREGSGVAYKPNHSIATHAELQKLRTH